MTHHEPSNGPLDAPVDDCRFVTVNDFEAIPVAPTEPLPPWPPSDDQVVALATSELAAAATGRRRFRPGGYVPRLKSPAMAIPGTRTHTRRRGIRRKPRLPRPDRRRRWLAHLATYARTFGITIGFGGALSAGGNLAWIGWKNRGNFLAPWMYLGAAIIGLAIISLIHLIGADRHCNCREPHG